MHPALVICIAAVCGAGAGAVCVPLINRFLIKLETNRLSVGGSAILIAVLSLVWVAIFALKGWEAGAFLLGLASSALLSLFSAQDAAEAAIKSANPLKIIFFIC